MQKTKLFLTFCKGLSRFFCKDSSILCDSKINQEKNLHLYKIPLFRAVFPLSSAFTASFL